MALGVRLALTEFGVDPRTVTLIALGGAGPVHACHVAQFLGIRRVLVPPYPGIACASGLLQTDLRHVYVRSRLASLRSIAPDEWPLELRRTRRSRASPTASVKASRRRRGARLQRRRPLSEARLRAHRAVRPELGADAVAQIEARFHDAHERVYGIAARGESVEIVNLRVVSEMVIPKLVFTKIETGGTEPAGGSANRNAARVL